MHGSLTTLNLVLFYSSCEDVVGAVAAGARLCNWFGFQWKLVAAVNTAQILGRSVRYRTSVSQGNPLRHTSKEQADLFLFSLLIPISICYYHLYVTRNR
jgi:hypothetical protein